MPGQVSESSCPRRNVAREVTDARHAYAPAVIAAPKIRVTTRTGARGPSAALRNGAPAATAAPIRMTR